MFDLLLDIWAILMNISSSLSSQVFLFGSWASDWVELPSVDVVWILLSRLLIRVYHPQQKHNWISHKRSDKKGRIQKHTDLTWWTEDADFIDAQHAASFIATLSQLWMLLSSLE